MEYVVSKNNQDELMHYGVLGMKWGVSRNPQRAYTKASKKLNKLDKSVEKKQVKAQKAYGKYTKAAGKTFLRDESDIAEKKQKFQKADAKYANSITKANKWYTNMEKAFKDTSVKLTSEQQSMGRRYVETMEYRLQRSGFDRW